MSVRLLKMNLHDAMLRQMVCFVVVEFRRRLKLVTLSLDQEVMVAERKFDSVDTEWEIH